LSETELSRFRGKAIGFIFQLHNLIPVLTAFENVELPMIINGIDKVTRIKRTLNLLKGIGLEHRINHRPDELSGGEQQRVAIVRALSNNPILVLADEPTGDLDWETGKQVIKQMMEAVKRERGTLILATHNREIADYANQRIELRSGRIYRVEPH
ncbi:MAG: ABC transporter ATP-binding protein, partial [Promethearchaeota archaeon]